MGDQTQTTTIVAELEDRMSAMWAKIGQAVAKVTSEGKKLDDELRKVQGDGKKAGDELEEMGSDGAKAGKKIKTGAEEGAAGVRKVGAETAKASTAMDSLASKVQGAFAIGSLIAFARKLYDIAEQMHKVEAVGEKIAALGKGGGVFESQRFGQIFRQTTADLERRKGKAAGAISEGLAPAFGVLQGEGNLQTTGSEQAIRQSIESRAQSLLAGVAKGADPAALADAGSALSKVTGEDFSKSVDKLIYLQEQTGKDLNALIGKVSATVERTQGAVDPNELLGFIGAAEGLGFKGKTIAATFDKTFNDRQTAEETVAKGSESGAGKEAQKAGAEAAKLLAQSFQESLMANLLQLGVSPDALGKFKTDAAGITAGLAGGAQTGATADAAAQLATDYRGLSGVTQDLTRAAERSTEALKKLADPSLTHFMTGGIDPTAIVAILQEFLASRQAAGTERTSEDLAAFAREVRKDPSKADEKIAAARDSGATEETLAQMLAILRLMHEDGKKPGARAPAPSKSAPRGVN